MDIEHFRNLIGYVPQEPVLFNTTIRENIIFGRENITEEEILEACRKAKALEFINNKEKGFDYIVGMKGSKLSGGQKQRIAIARAILKKPKFLILDEATSALDNESEKFVQAALDSVAEGITTIIIAHRLSTIINSDCIVVLKDGKIMESGTHQDLLNKKGYYSILVKHQMSTIDNANSLAINNNTIDNNINGNVNANDIDNNKLDSNSKRKNSNENRNNEMDKLKENNNLNNSKDVKNKDIINNENDDMDIADKLKREKEKEKEMDIYFESAKKKLLPIIMENKCTVFLGAFFASCSGAIWPCYGLLLAFAIEALSQPIGPKFKEDGEKLGIYFTILACCAGICYFFQK